MKKKLKTAGLVIVGFLLVAQLVPVARTNPPETSPLQIPADVEPILQKACYDCHSNKTKWPWYSGIAPLSWWIVDHVNEGRRELNFSEWNAIPAEKRAKKFEEIAEEVEEGEMPLKTYTPAHPEAVLTPQEVATLVNWAKAQERSLRADGRASETQEHHDE